MSNKFHFSCAQFYNHIFFYINDLITKMLSMNKANLSLHIFPCLLGWLGFAAKLPSWFTVYGRANGSDHRYRDCTWRFPIVDNYRGPSTISNQLTANVHQVHKWASAGSQSWTQANLCGSVFSISAPQCVLICIRLSVPN